ncbi:MAG: HEAT repeat domain-containing protein [Nitrospiraceae bacterium]|nr:HEAT repeat domain-containing protein [Nitrospiraceae bacterium]
MLEDIRKNMESADIETRIAAVQGLRRADCEGRRLGDCVELLAQAMLDPSWRVRKSAQEILLARFAPEAYAPRLIKLLYLEDNAGARNAAIETLLALNKKAVPWLVEAFDSDNADVRKFVIDILGEFRDSRSLPVFLKALRDENENVKASAVEHLGRVGEPSVIDALIAILENEDLWMAYPAADALGRIGDARAVPALIKALGRKPLRGPALKALGSTGGTGAAGLIAPYLADQSKAVQQAALLALYRLYKKGGFEGEIATGIKNSLGGPAVSFLKEFVRGEDAEAKTAAISFLGLLKDPAAIQGLLEAGAREEFAESATQALILILEKEPLAIFPWFEHKDHLVRRGAVAVAARISNPAYYDYFLSLLSDEDGHIRSIAALGLSGCGKPEAVDHVMRLFEDPYEDVQEEAVAALARLRQFLDENRLRKGLESREMPVRKNMITLTGKLRLDHLVQDMGFALKDEMPPVRKAAVAALAETGTPQCIKYLISALSDEDPDIRASAALSLGPLGGPEAVDRLCMLLEDHVDMVRAAAANALGVLGDKSAAQCLVRLLPDKNGFVVAMAVKSLGMIGGDEARRAITRMLSYEDAEIRRAAIKALADMGAVGGAFRDLLSGFLKDADWATRLSAVEAAAMDPEARAELEPMLDAEEDPVVLKAVRKALGLKDA